MSESKRSDEFAGDVVIVTGASSGIGLACAVRFAEAGARVVVFARSTHKLEQLAERWPDRMMAVTGDASREDDLRNLVTSTEKRFGACTVLVNNAGHIEPKPVEEMTIDEWDLHFSVNVRAAFLTSRLALPGMRRAGRGSIINVSSISGIPGPQKFPGFAAYCASKGALISFTEALAVELKGSGVRANCVSPGSVDTPMLRRVAPTLEAEISPEDMAELVAFLASPRSLAMNGQNLHGVGA